MGADQYLYMYSWSSSAWKLDNMSESKWLFSVIFPKAEIISEHLRVNDMLFHEEKHLQFILHNKELYIKCTMHSLMGNNIIFGIAYERRGYFYSNVFIDHIMGNVLINGKMWNFL